MHPPLGILKINFDGSFICSTRRGGIGGGVKESIGIVVRSFSGPLEALDANEVEVLLFWWAAMSCVKWAVSMLFLKVIALQLCSGVLIILLILGGWRLDQGGAGYIVVAGCLF